MFRSCLAISRRLKMAPHGVAVEETSGDPHVLDRVRRHAAEVTALVCEGMPAIVKGMMP